MECQAVIQGFSPLLRAQSVLKCLNYFVFLYTFNCDRKLPILHLYLPKFRPNVFVTKLLILRYESAGLCLPLKASSAV